MTSGRPEWDVVVVGAGPAGASAALSVLTREPSARVLLLDREDFPRDKCCGDGIAPHVLDVLRQLDPEVAGRVVAGWQPVRRLALSRNGSDASGVEREMSRPTYVVPRMVFDARLVACAQRAGATLRRQRVRSLERQGDVVLVDGSESAAVVIGADGPYSLVRKAIGLPATGRRAMAIRGYAPTRPEWGGRQVIRYGDRRSPSYAWAFDRGDGLANVGYGELTEAPDLTRAILLDELERLLPAAASTGTSWRAHHLPLSGWGWEGEQPDGPVLLAGDAAGLVNPMTGEGIYYAVATGSLAGAAAVAALGATEPESAGARHRAAVRRLLRTHLHHTWVTSRLSRSPRVVDAGLAAAARDGRIFDDLVEIGLGHGRLTTRTAVGLVAERIRLGP